MHILRKKGEAEGEVALRDEEGGRDVRQGRADPFRSAASLVDRQSEQRQRGSNARMEP